MRLMRLLVAAAVALDVGAAGPALAQSYPDRPIKLIVPLDPGGPVDTIARVVAKQLTEEFERNVNVINRSGAAGMLGIREVMTAAPDGYTLAFGSSGTLVIAPALYGRENFDPSSLEPVALVAQLPHVLVVAPELPVKSVRELVDYAKANSGKLSFGGALGMPPHLMGALFNEEAGLDATFIPYKGASSSIVDLLAGRTQFTFDALTVLNPLIVQGKVRPLAAINGTRWPQLPDVPTMVEAGFPDFTMIPYLGVLAPPGTPQSIVDTLDAAINKGLATEEMRQTLMKFSSFAQPGSAQDFAALIKASAPVWAKLVKLSGAALQ